MTKLNRMFLAIAFLLLAACGKYNDFTLPPMSAELALRVRPVFVESPSPVMGRGNSTDVLNPSVLFASGTFLNFYSEYDGRAWHSALASSQDGLAWKPQGRFLSPDPKTWEGTYIAANGAATRLNGAWAYWYVAGNRERPQIGFVSSSDLKTWTKHTKPVLVPGPRGSFDEYGVADPYIVRVGSWLYMYYLGQNRAREQQIGLARSVATGPGAGLVWEKLRANPVLRISAPGSGAMDESGLGEPAVWDYAGKYWMLFTGRDLHENRALGMAESLDGVNWVRLFTLPRGGAWDAKVMCDPTVMIQGGRTLVWFGGGDVARPDENIHGQIGMGEIRWEPIP